uniref:Uncharacterized protein n=1 Tax=Terrapene triunguis TaxID=2587831 RepID=A0A674J6S3_9SAUR
MSRRTMDWLVLLGCVSLWAGLALAEVGSFSNCTEYFCRGAEPSGFHTPRTAEICQRYKNQYRFATLYDKANQIPRWSAYILRPSNCPGQPRRLSKWFVEPQVSPSALCDALRGSELLRQPMNKGVQGEGG